MAYNKNNPIGYKEYVPLCYKLSKGKIINNQRKCNLYSYNKTN